MSNKSAKWPKGIPYIIGNEAAERYSFYGMKAILLIFLTEFVKNSAGNLDLMTGAQAVIWVHVFIFAAYGISFVGAFIADAFWGKYKTIMVLSIVYCIGHFVLALFETRMGFLFGCGLIAIGSGGIKPCVSSHVGDQFEESNSHLIERMYNYFYLAINAGAVIAYLSAERILQNPGLIKHGLNGTVAFGLPGVLMVIATLVFWIGRHKYVSIKPIGYQNYVKELFSSESLRFVSKVFLIYVFAAVFFCVFDQTGSAWVNQAQSDMMDKSIQIFRWQFNFLPSEIGFFNPLLIVIMVPVVSSVLYPFLRKYIPLKYTQRISIGLFIAAITMVLITWVQYRMDHGTVMSIKWQIVGYLLLTISEIFVSVSVLEFSYTQAKNSMKSMVSSFYLLSVAAGNAITIVLTALLIDAKGNLKIEWSTYFLIFTGLMCFMAVLFPLLFGNFKEETIIQDRKNAY